MNRSWITALTLATVAGSGGAFAVIAGSADAPAAAQAPTPTGQGTFLRAETPATPARTLSYQVGAAGTATLTIANGSLIVDNAVANTGWTVTSASGAGTHVDAQFTDGTQVVTFGADLVGSDVVVVSLTNVPAAAPVTAVPAETVSADVAQGTALAHTTTSRPEPAMPASTVASAAVEPPATSATTAPSGSGGTGDEGSDEHETESNDD